MTKTITLLWPCTAFAKRRSSPENLILVPGNLTFLPENLIETPRFSPKTSSQAPIISHLDGIRF